MGSHDTEAVSPEPMLLLGLHAVEEPATDTVRLWLVLHPGLQVEASYVRVPMLQYSS